MIVARAEGTTLKPLSSNSFSTSVVITSYSIHYTKLYEISGVSTAPEFRGRGFGALLSRFVAGQIAASGETPFLHAFADNTAAISVYRGIGFSVRRTMQVAALKA